jgi:pimeloyl-ACP methyl ester carboxylesterase
MEISLLGALKVLAAVVVGVPLAVYFMQDGMIFYRQPIPEARRAEIAQRFPAAGELVLDSADGVRVHAWHVKAPGPLVIYFGGNAEEVSWMLDRVGNPERGETPGVGWLLVNYRGYGPSGGSPSERALVEDALGMYDLAVALPGVDKSRIFAFGRSLGSGVAVQLAAKRPIRGLILATPYDSIAAVAKRYYWYLPVDLMLKHRFDSLALAPAMKQPLLALIAERDEVIPPSHGDVLYEAWGGVKARVLLTGAGHNSTDSHPLFWSEVRKFIAQEK